MYNLNSRLSSPETLSTDAMYLSQVLRASAMWKEAHTKSPLGCISLCASHAVVL
jgi:hypothetical protein